MNAVKAKTSVTDENQQAISLLVNSPYYYMGCVFIVTSKDQYRLLAIHNDRLLIDQLFPTLRGAKISFARLFRTNSWQKTMKPIWSELYPPDTDWISEKLNVVKKSPGAAINMRLH